MLVDMLDDDETSEPAGIPGLLGRLLYEELVPAPPRVIAWENLPARRRWMYTHAAIAVVVKFDVMVDTGSTTYSTATEPVAPPAIPEAHAEGYQPPALPDASV